MSDQAGTVDIHYDADIIGFASIDSSLVHLPMRNQPLQKTRSIKTETIDAYCQRNGIDNIDIFKIDVEGHELAVLKGAKEMLRTQRIRAVAYEIGPHQMAGREFYKDFYDFFDEMGYRNLRYREAGWKAAPITEYTSSLEKFDQVCMRMAVRP